MTLIALHDIGKFAAPFQAKCPEFYPPSLSPWSGSTHARHDEIGSAVRDSLDLHGMCTPNWSRSDFDELWHAVTGHHGKPRVVADPPLNVQDMPRASRVAATAFASDVISLHSPSPGIARPQAPSLASLSWHLVGLTVVADWVGSNRDWFPYCRPELPLPIYWTRALSNAEKAITLAGLRPAPLSTKHGADHILPAHIAAHLSPLQRQAEAVELPDGPVLAVIEDVTGSGKTEAALLLASRLLHSGRGSGLFFALPTMATANAMFDRLGDGYRRLYAHEARPSLVLAHGKRGLNKDFQGSLLPAAPSSDGYDDGGGAACAAWIADDRRKAFLAHVGVGTIDQAILGVLPSKHQSLRLWGLGDRVLIIDEAHAYDAYMSKEIETLLQFHAALGGSAIVLSATLAAAQRHAILSAFGKGLGVAQTTAPRSDAYPALTVASASGVVSHAVATRADRRRRLPVRRLASVEAAVAEIIVAHNTGAAVAWIRNSVDDAIEAVELLKEHGLQPVLLHARFAMGDRLDIESEVTRTLGRDDKTGRRKGYVLVGTQILEESLDYDVDVMITDLAPIDLMIQRAGRLWRHPGREPRPIAAPELLVLSPDPAGDIDKDWYRQISRRGAAVYEDHGIVWRSAKSLFEAGQIETPDGVRGLIERVYASAEIDDIPLALHAQAQRAIGNRSAARSFAQTNLLNVLDGYAGSSAVWTADTITPTRLGQAMTVFRLGRLDGDHIIPWCEDDDRDARRSWALSEVSVAARRADGIPEPDAVRAALISTAKVDWPEWEREQPLLVLEADGDAWRGTASKTGDAHHEIRYDKRVGFRIVET